MTFIGVEESVLFLGSKLFMSGKRVSAKTNLTQLSGLEEGRALGFDAVPCDPVDGGRYGWFATVVWKGRKPDMEYDNVRPKQQSALPQLTEMKLVRCFILCYNQLILIYKTFKGESQLPLDVLKFKMFSFFLFFVCYCCCILF